MATALLDAREAVAAAMLTPQVRNEASRLLNALLRESGQQGPGNMPHYTRAVALVRCAAYKAVAAAEPAVQARSVAEAIEFARERTRWEADASQAFLNVFLRRKLILPEEVVGDLVLLAALNRTFYLSIGSVVSFVERWLGNDPPERGLATALRALEEQLAVGKDRQERLRVQILLNRARASSSGQAEPEAVADVLDPAVKLPARGRDGGSDKARFSKVLERMLLEREGLTLEMPRSLTETLLNAMWIPPKDNETNPVWFASEVIPELTDAIEAVNRALQTAKPDYIDEERQGWLALKAVDDHGPRHPMLAAVAASSLAALSHRQIRAEWRSRRADRFHNGAVGLMFIAERTLDELTEAPANVVGAWCDAWSRCRDFEYLAADFPALTAVLIPKLQTLEDWPTHRVLLLQLLRFRERLARSRQQHVIAQLDQTFGLSAGFPLELGERWSDRAYIDICGMPKAQREAWIELLRICALAKGTTPSTKWLDSIAAALLKLPKGEVQQRLCTWFSLVGRPRPTMPGGPVEGRDSSIPSDRAADALRGMAWAASRFDSPRMALALGDLALACYKMVPGNGARSVKPGTSAVWALMQMSVPEALAQLSRVRQLVKFATAKKVLDSAFEKLSTRMNLSTDELHELAAPDFGLDAQGMLREEAGHFTLQVRIVASSAELRVLTSDGAERKTIPASVKTEHAETLKSLKGLANDINKMLPAQKSRLERLYLDERTWPLDIWRARYLDHPLVGTLARRLIWVFASRERIVSGIADAGGFIDATGARLTLKGDEQVALWHPIRDQAESVRAWRTLLETREIRQPFKQAHREVYLLTDAERQTAVYSNRFAAHIIRQSQYTALCQERGWRYELFVMDSGGPGVMLLPRHSLTACFDLRSIGSETYGGVGAYTFLETDRVRFSDARSGDVVSLKDLDPLVFSEVMRDVDLFVGVCSIGNSPEWEDAGEGAGEGGEGGGQFRDYSREFGFGELSQSAAGRIEVLRTLLPRLRIAHLCSLDGRFLRVRGQLRTYKIHLGSGNILMDPNDQYLCIVPGIREWAAAGVFLPFEGDRMLAIILSKAFLLAEDDKIKDSWILKQIRRK